MSPGRGGHGFPFLRLSSLQTFDLAIDPVQSQIDRTRTREHFVRGDHLRFGVPIAVSTLGFIECLPVRFLDTAFSHDMQVTVERRGELACVPIEFDVAGASAEQVLAKLFVAANQFYLPAFCPFGGALGEERPP
ncbi:hypothetical protein SPAR_41909 [Streptomyces sparsogenes DSM 40356]|uniref:Uncharacterized protein n=1 Tax=Streptomyces sparsogenes DSM 40356 TaxID=1331668 RepID=A0A1R1S4W6_9ACTN|nr:hypothetical protein SPAR_41909 [Streptomyces sparsogenes DSM 40356]